MILCDAGPLIALIDVAEIDNHHLCRATLPKLRGPHLTTWPCITEAMYFLGQRGGPPLQRMLLRYIETSHLHICNQAETDVPRIQMLMDTYQDLPMDLADASLVVAAETLNLTQVFTIDSHFHAYRINDKTPFEVFPG